MVFVVCRGVSGFIAFTILLALSSILAIYVYTYSMSLYPVYKPKQSYIYSYVLCYNTSNISVVLLNNITLCKPGSQSFSNTSYLCVFRVGLKINLTVVYMDHTEDLYVDRNCVSFLNNLPVKVFGYSNDLIVIFEVKHYDPWSK